MPPSPELDTTVPVLLLRTDPCAIHHGSVAIARRLGRLGVSVYAIVEDRYTPLAMCRYLTGAFVDKPTDIDSLLSWVQAIGDAMQRRAVLLPTDDRSSVFVAVHEFIARASFPVVVKAGEHSHCLKNRRSGCVVETPEELLALFGPDGSLLQNIILQEYIPGEDWIFHGYSNPLTDCFVGFTGRKLRSHPPFAGTTTLGVSMLNEPLREQAEAMLKVIGFCGIVDLDYRRDERDGRYKLLDFNPRVGANF